MIHLYRFIAFILAIISSSIIIYLIVIIYICIVKCVEKTKIWRDKNYRYRNRKPSEEYLKKQRDNMEDFIWNRMDKNLNK